MRSKSSGEPFISVITPSFNQGQYIEDTIRSVLGQDFTDFEYIIIDGGSSDNTLDVIKKYDLDLDFWESKQDGGQSDALRKGFSRARGKYLCWQNSDDMFAPGALRDLATAALQTNAAIVSGNLRLCNSAGEVFRQVMYSPVSYADLPYVKASIPNQCAIFRRDVYEAIGGIDTSLRYCMDLDLWARMLAHSGGTNVHVRSCFGIYRAHEETKTALLADVHDAERTVLCETIKNTVRTSIIRSLFKKLYFHISNGDFSFLIGKLGLKLRGTDKWAS